MKQRTKKLVGILCIIGLLGTVGVTTVSAMGMFNSNGRTSFLDLKNKWEDIQAEKQELRDLAEGYGVDLPDLTGEQKREVFRTVRELRRDGANREEIRDAVVDLLINFGVDLPDLTSEQRVEIRTDIKTMLEDNYGFVFIKLTPEQKAYIKQTFIQMKRQGASQEELKEAVKNLYIGYGGVIPVLTENQKEEIHDWIVDMLETEYGLDLPNLTLEQRDTLKEKRSEIKELQKDLRELFKDAGFFTKRRFLRYIQTTLD